MKDQGQRGRTHSGALRASWVTALLFVGLGYIGSAIFPAPVSSQTADPAAFLEKLAGEWSMVSEARPGPDMDPIRSEGHESARWLGDRWLVAETTSRTPDGGPLVSIWTLQWNEHEGRFVGTWISSQQDHLWSHSGELNAEATALTLETEGPLLGDPTTTVRYREVIEHPQPDLKVVRSLIMGPDGEWFEYGRAEYRREE